MVSVPVRVRWFPLALVALATTAGCGRLHEHPLVVEAVNEMRANERVAELLGKPLECSRSVRGTANETDGIANLEFDAKGPKGSGVVVVEGKKTRGTWGVVKLDLQPAGGEKLSLHADLAARTGTDTPAFDPGAAAATPSTAPPPPGEIEITLPPGPPGQ
ncbi:MAG: cytochrome c oxidase assembly factor Coa1 family protein [Planctomycetota bacterium]